MIWTYAALAYIVMVGAFFLWILHRSPRWTEQDIQEMKLAATKQRAELMEIIESPEKADDEGEK